MKEDYLHSFNVPLYVSNKRGIGLKDLARPVDWTSKPFTLMDVMSLLENSTIPISSLAEIFQCPQHILREIMLDLHSTDPDILNSAHFNGLVFAHESSPIEKEGRWVVYGTVPFDPDRYGIDFSHPASIRCLNIQKKGIMFDGSKMQEVSPPCCTVLDLIYAVVQELSMFGGMDGKKAVAKELELRVSRISKT